MKPSPDLSPLPDLDLDLIAGIDKFIATHSDPEAGMLSRNDAINRILRDWLTRSGYVEPDAEQQDFDDPTH
ncbi:hypothetical protein [Devosia sp. RR2S18]|jgi:hypothetical protein|uniref:hypothetical protein n=1 Tax=Devosia rhizosphaerae TaxID=3049774 RepID=UPI0025421DD2|nr:hypothetical protein [Devosia sp. RR2S18]WIJ25174.1 hypothetical protein QOV41_19550 [Devosia sp. RR2S18]HEV7292477.1 hypothetical protein [Devosia sp.]